MRAFRILLGRELGATFHSFGVYALLALVAGITALVYQGRLQASGLETGIALSGIYTWLFYLTVVLTPLLTMRLFAEEKRSGSFELLMTAPVSDSGVVAAKYAGSVLVFLTFLAPVWAIFGILALLFGAAPDWGQLAATSIGLVSAGLVFLAFGTFASAVSSMQLWAALLAILGNFAMGLFGWLRGMMPPESGLARVLTHMDIQTHLETSLVGIIDLRHLVYQLSLTALWLFWTVRVVEARKWR